MTEKKMNIRSRFLLLLPLAWLFMFGQTAFAQQKLPLDKAIKQIEQRFGANLSFEQDLLKGKFTSAESLAGNKLEDVLKRVLYPNQLVFLYVDDKSYNIVRRSENSPIAPTDKTDASASASATQQIDRIGGTVRSASGKPIPFAGLWIKDTRKGGKTDDNGRFLLYDVQPSDILIVTALGFADASVQIGHQRELQIVMQEQENVLEEVVVSTGYQKISKERATGAASVIKAEDLEKIQSPNLLQRMEMLAPGLQIKINTGDRSFSYNNNQLSLASSTRTVGASDLDMNVRGIGTLTSSNEKTPLVVVDGAISNIDLASMNPNDVETITILKDAAAASIYGVRAANGVIVITTKRGNNNGVPRINFSANTAFSGKPDLGYLNTMDASQMIDYQEELVAKDILTMNNLSTVDYNQAINYPGIVPAAAIRLKNGLISDQEYAAIVDPLRQIDNRSQIQEYLLGPMSNQQYNFSFSNGTPNSSYFYSTSYSKENPYTRGDTGSRLTLNLNNSWKLFGIATLSTSFKGSFLKHQKNGLALAEVLSTGQNTLLPYQLLADGDGQGVAYDRLNPEFVSMLGPAYKNWSYNYLQERGLAENIQKDNNYMATFNLEAPVYKGLKANVLFSNERTFSNTRRYHDEDSYYNRDLLNRFTPIGASTNALGVTRGGIYELMNTTINNYTLRGQLNYDAIFDNVHEISAIAGSEIRQTELGQGSNTLYGYNKETGFNTTVNYNYNGYSNTLVGYPMGVPGSPTQGDRRRRFLSYFGNAAYTFQRKYTVSGSVRYDDYNNFGLDRSFRATPLWSAGVKWNASQETFLHEVTWLDRLSLRATYGVNGNINQDLRPFTYIAMSDGNINPTRQPYASIIGLANPQLRWEKTYVTNIGIDFTLFQNRISGTIDYYNKDGRDLLYQFPISTTYTGSIGGGTLTRNTASMTGRGVDIELHGVALRRKDWQVDLSAMLSYNTNEVTDNRFDPALISQYTYSYTPRGISYLVGYPSDKLFVFRHAGLDANGLTQVYNKDGEIVSATQNLSSVEDLKYAGRTMAPYFGSFRPNIRYKQLSLYALIVYQFGNVFMKPSIENYMTAGRGATVPNWDLSADIDRRWREPGDEHRTNVPVLVNGVAGQNSLQRYQNADINVLKGDYVRIREIALNYALPKSILNRIGVDAASITGSVRNLGLLWTANDEGYDPDFIYYVGNTTNLRPVPTYNFGVNVSF